MKQQQASNQKNTVALSGQVAGNTALCTVGRSGNDLHYRGYDILDLAAGSQFVRSCSLARTWQITKQKLNSKRIKTKLKDTSWLTSST